MQTKRQSIIEISTGIGIGVVGSFAITFVAMHNIEDRALCSLVTVLGCTAWSFVRGYGLRRYFNAKIGKQQEKPHG